MKQALHDSWQKAKSEESEEVRLKHRSKELWGFLRPRIRLLVEAEAAGWGAIQQLYPRVLSQFTHDRVRGGETAVVTRKWVVHPESGFAFGWDMAQVTVMLWILITFPLEFSFEQDECDYR